MTTLNVITLLIIIGLHGCLGTEPEGLGERDGTRTEAVANHPPHNSHEHHKWHKNHGDQRTQRLQDDSQLQRSSDEGGKWHGDERAVDEDQKQWKNDDGRKQWHKKQDVEKLQKKDKKWQHDREHKEGKEWRISEGRKNNEKDEGKKWHKKHGDEKKRKYKESSTDESGKVNNWRKNNRDDDDTMDNGEDGGVDEQVKRQKNILAVEAHQEKHNTGQDREDKRVYARDGAVPRNERSHNVEKKLKIQHLPGFSSPPNPNDTILMARYIVHTVDWAGMSTVTTRGLGGPFSNVVSISDGPQEEATGVPYFYMTPLDLSSQDATHDNRVSIVVTLAQTSYCRSRGPPALDPEDPRCARLILSGKLKRVKPGTPEDQFARNALFSRHPTMKTWPQDHGFFTAKLKIGQVILLDQFGGPKYLDVKDYLHPLRE